MEDARGALLDEGTLARLDATFRSDGIAVLQNVIPHAVLDTIAARLDFDAAHQYFDAARVAVAEGAAAGGDGLKEDGAPAASFSGDVARLGLHLELGLPRTPELVFPEIVCNPIIEQAVARLLGPAFIRYYNGNTACPASGTQPLHMDGGGWSVASADEAAAAGLEWPHEPLKLSVNFGVDDMRPENGSTEVYLGSHRDTRAAVNPGGHGSHVENVAAMRAAEGNGPSQVFVPKGGVVFRDLRVFHRGVSNTSDLPRHMMCVGYNAERDPGANCSHMGAGKVPHVRAHISSLFLPLLRAGRLVQLACKKKKKKPGVRCPAANAGCWRCAGVQ
jgi:hypothetical protein